MRLILLAAALVSFGVACGEEIQPRARDLGIPFSGTPGKLNAITDVAGVTVGHATIVRDLPENRAVRTGVTAVVPRGAASNDTLVYAGSWALNGNGELTGAAWIEEGGFLEGPVMLTNTHSVGAVHEGTIRWRVQQGDEDHTGYTWSTAVVGETWDGYLNDINGFHVRPEHAMAALDAATGGPVREGNVGGGTGMICFEFKCGIGTSSRIARVNDTDFTIGVLVQANYGSRRNLRVAGVPIGVHMPHKLIYSRAVAPATRVGSVIVVIATDAPLLPYQLKRLTKRVSLAIGATGDTGHNGSGDFFVAFSTANEEAGEGRMDATIRSVPNDSMDPLFEATVNASEEAIINALVAGREMRGDGGNFASAIDHEQLRSLLRKNNRLLE